ncbi:MAG: hypothetical protein AABW72_00105 [archaeon]
MAYNSANTTLTVGSTNITSRTWNSINPFDSFTMISGPMSSMMDMVVYENKPLLVGNSTRVYELAGTWASKIALTNTSYINQIEKLDNNYIITTIGSDNKAHVFTIDSSNNKTELSTIPNNATSIVSLGIDNIGKIWINTGNPNNIYYYQNNAWQQVINPSGSPQLILGTKSGKIYVVSNVVGTGYRIYVRNASDAWNAAWTQIADIANVQKIVDIVEDIFGNIYVLAEMNGNTVSIYLLDENTGWELLKNFGADMTKGSKILAINLTAVFVSGYTSNNAKLFMGQCSPDNPPTADITAVISDEPVQQQNNQITINSTDWIFLNGSNSTDDLGIAAYLWEQTSGDPKTINNSTAETSNIQFNANDAGKTFDFKLTVTDTGGQTAFDAVKITIKSAAQLTLTILANGQDANLEVMPGTSPSLVGIASNGTEPYAYQWTQISGPAKDIGNANNSMITPAISANEAGNVYEFKLTVSDAKAQTAFDVVKVSVIIPTFTIQTDSSCTWKEKYNFGAGKSVLSLIKGNDGTAYAGVSSSNPPGEIYKSADNGSNWTLFAGFGNLINPTYMLIDSAGDLFVAGINDKYIYKIKPTGIGYPITGTILGSNISGMVETVDGKILVSTNTTDTPPHKFYLINKSNNTITLSSSASTLKNFLFLTTSDDKTMALGGGNTSDGNGKLLFNIAEYQNWPIPIYSWPNITQSKQPNTKDALVSAVEWNNKGNLLALTQKGEIHKYGNDGWNGIGKFNNMINGQIAWKLKKIDSEIYALMNKDSGTVLAKSSDYGNSWIKYAGLETAALATEIIKGADNKIYASIATTDNKGKIYYLDCPQQGQNDQQQPCTKTCAENETLDETTCTCVTQGQQPPTPPGGGSGDGGVPGSPGGPQLQPGQQTVFEKTLNSENLSAEEIELMLGMADKDEYVDDANKISPKISVTKEIKTIAKGNDANTYVTLNIKNVGDETYKDIFIIEIIPKEILQSAKDIKSNNKYGIVTEDPIIEYNIAELKKGENEKFEYYFKKDLSKLKEEDIDKWEAAFAYDGEEANGLCANVICKVIACKESTCDLDDGKCKYTDKKEGTNCGTNKKCTKGKCIAVKADINADADMNANLDQNIGTGFELPKLPLMEIGIAIILLILAVAGFWFVKNKEKQEENAEQTKEEAIAKDFNFETFIVFC